MKTIEDANIIWYDLRVKYLDDRIYPSMWKSIIENFEFRVFSHDKTDKAHPFPIKLIRSIFTNAAKLRKYAEKGDFDSAILEEATEMRVRFESIVGMTVDRVKLCVAKPGYDVSEHINSSTDLPDGMWMYPVGAIRKLGFHPFTGEIFIQLYREDDNIRQMYSLNPDTNRWEKVTGVEKLSQLYLKRIPGMKEIMFNNMPDLPVIREVAKRNLYSDLLKAKDYKQHYLLWKRLLPLLPSLLREVLALLAQYNIVLTMRKHKRYSK